MRPILLFLFIALLAIVVLQNLSPSVALTFLGMQTVALPLAVWLVGAVLAGAITTVLVATLIRFLAKGRFAKRSLQESPRRRARRPSSTQGEPWTPPPWTGGWTKPLDPEPVDRAGNAPRSTGTAWAAAEDDWENPRPSNEWNDWEDAPRASTAGSRTVIQDVPYREISPPIEPEPAYRDRPYETESAYQYRPYETDAAAESAYQYRPYEVVEEPPEADNSAGYQYRPYLDEEPEEEREVWDDWEEEPPAKPASSRSPEEPPAEPRRPIVEINREPETGYRAGTVYSFSYRRAEPDTPTDNIKAPPDESPKSATQHSAGAASSDAPAARSAGTSTDRPADSATANSPSQESTKPGSIYEADFRVVAPPRYPEEEPIALDEGEDKGDWEEDGDRPIAPGNDYDSSDRGEVWDDESWGDIADEPVARRGSLNREIWDDWDDEDDENRDGDNPHPGSEGSGRSPEGNPPLRLG